VYLPYVTEEDKENIAKAQLVKGGEHIPAKLVVNPIEDVEKDYNSLRLSKETGWFEFITKGWSRILTAEVPKDLDLHYSGELCAVNLNQELEAQCGGGKKEPKGAAA